MEAAVETTYKAGGFPMAPRNGSDGLIRLGALALPLAGLLALVGLYSSFQLGTGES